jgi:hypothetical protein
MVNRVVAMRPPAVRPSVARPWALTAQAPLASVSTAVLVAVVGVGFIFAALHRRCRSFIRAEEPLLAA